MTFGKLNYHATHHLNKRTKPLMRQTASSFFVKAHYAGKQPMRSVKTVHTDFYRDQQRSRPCVPATESARRGPFLSSDLELCLEALLRHLRIWQALPWDLDILKVTCDSPAWRLVDVFAAGAASATTRHEPRAPQPFRGAQAS